MDRVRLFAVGIALLLTVLASAYLYAVHGLGGAHLLSAHVAFSALKLAPAFFGAALLAGLVACYFAFFVPPKGGRVAALLSVVVSLSLGALTTIDVSAAKRAPQIADVSTDLADRPVFSEKIKALRPKGAIALEVDQRTIDLQRASYPKIKTMPFAAPTDAVFDASLRAMQKRKLEIVNADKAAGIVEATNKTHLFNAPQDVVVRIRPTDTGSLIDIRAAIRWGQSDYGANARTIKNLQREIKAQF